MDLKARCVAGACAKALQQRTRLVAHNFGLDLCSNWVGLWDDRSTPGARRKGSRQTLFERNWIP
jgi:hypothetical protein